LGLCRRQDYTGNSVANFGTALWKNRGEIGQAVSDGIIIGTNGMTGHLLEGRGIPGWADSDNALARNGSAGQFSKYAGYASGGALAFATGLGVAGVAAVLWGGGTAAASNPQAVQNVGVYLNTSSESVVNYVGISNNMARRAAEQAVRGFDIKPIPGLQNLSRFDARAVEQVLIEHYELMKNGGTLLNKINSISPSNPAYQQAIQRGDELLQNANYPGFGG
jgi:hypothetical protein